MKVALLGATGFVGSALLKEALDRGIRSRRLCAIPKNSKNARALLEKLATSTTPLALQR